ncbi:MAG: SRPBCC family protein [Pirellulaceae bacterium]
MNFADINLRVHAKHEDVFEVISDVRNFAKAVPDITKVEFLTDQKSGEGTRFREFRQMKDKEHSTVLSVTEMVPNRMIRMVADAGGAEWDSVFSVVPRDDETDLSMKMVARPHNFLAKLMLPLMRSMIRKAVEKDMVAVKEYCERNR